MGRLMCRDSASASRRLSLPSRKQPLRPSCCVIAATALGGRRSLSVPVRGAQGGVLPRPQRGMVELDMAARQRSLAFTTAGDPVPSTSETLAQVALAGARLPRGGARLFPAQPRHSCAPACRRRLLRACAGLGFIAVDALLMYGPPRRWIAARIERAAHKRLQPAEKATLLRLVIARLCSLLHISFTVPPAAQPTPARPRTYPPRPRVAWHPNPWHPVLAHSGLAAAGAGAPLRARGRSAQVPLSLVLLWRGDLAPDRLYAQNWLSWRMLTFSAGYFVYDVYVHTLRFEYAAGLAHAVGACAVFCVGTALGIQHFYGAPAHPPAAR